MWSDHDIALKEKRKQNRLPIVDSWLLFTNYSSTTKDIFVDKKSVIIYPFLILRNFLFTYNRNSSSFQNFLYIFRINIGVLIFIQIVCVSFPLSAYHANNFPTKRSVEQYVGTWQTKSPSEPMYQGERWKISEK